MGKEIKVLHVLESFAFGGTEAYVMNNCKALINKNVKFDFITMSENINKGHIEDIEKLGGKIFIISQKNKKLFVKSFKEIVKKHGGYDVVHSHLNVRNFFVMYAAKKSGVKKRISHIHSVHEWEKNIIKKCYRFFQIYIIKKYSTEVLACSSLAGRSLCGNKWFDKYGFVANNGINIDKFINDDLEVLNNKSFTITNITRFDDNKNQKFVLEVFYEINKLSKDFRLVLGGPDAGTLDEIKKQIKNYNIEDKVLLLGPQKEINKHLKTTDVFIFPSKKEGLGIVLLEAQASGCLCVASSSVPKTVDMGIGSMYFLDLEDGAKYWAEFIIAKLKFYIKPCREIITEKFNRNAFSINVSSERLKQFYETKS